MPKFAKTCNNPFHDEWSDGFEGSSRIVNLRAYNLDEFASAFAKFSSDEKNYKVTPIKINQICKNCLQQCLKKKNFIRYLPHLPSTDKIEKKVSYNFAKISLKMLISRYYTTKVLYILNLYEQNL
jgi:hypothetical protein